MKAKNYRPLKKKSGVKMVSSFVTPFSKRQVAKQDASFGRPLRCHGQRGCLGAELAQGTQSLHMAADWMEAD